MSRITAVAVAVAFIAVAFGVYGVWRSAASEAVLHEETTSVLVAATEMPAGHVVEASDLRAAALPKSAVPGGAATSTADVVGKTTVAPVPMNSVMTSSAVTGAGSETLAAAIEPGMVATTVVVNQQTGLSGQIHQGDKVDVYAIIDGEGNPSLIIARNATVLSLNASMAGYTAEYTSVTLEVTENEASMIAPVAAGGHAVLVMKPKAEGVI